ncbi:MAG: peptidyl-prolyl cis-trans isomerase [Bacteroidia bacterium]|nr:peptidyl-prolyl cis-trans isomerase [Bacteroidia bacterium]MDW8089468.1 peptidyl-prolyl cis-trans isomerase [Bacteroidia bacterium]
MAGVIQRIRDKAGLVVILIGLSLLIFILTDLLQSSAFIQEVLFGRSDVVARIGGETISYNEYQRVYEREMRGSTPDNPFAEDQMRAAIWQRFLTRRLYEYEATRASLTVTPEELYEMFVSDNPHPVVLQLFTRENQTYDKNKMQQVLARAANDPNLAAQLREFEDYLVETRLREKYDALIRTGDYLPSTLVAYKNALDSITVSLRCLVISYSAVADSLVPISEADLRRYYEAHKAEYQLREPERRLHYVVFFKDPSAEDSALTYRRLMELREPFARATEDSLFAASNSDIPQPFSFVRWPEVMKEVQDSIKTVGQVIGPYRIDQGYALTKVDTIVRDSQPIYRLRHIMISKGLDTVAARRKADSLWRTFRRDRFAELANQYSDDFQSKYASGELGWYGPDGRFGKAFYEALSKLPIGKPYGVITSEIGYHIVEVQEKEDRRVRLATIVKEITPGSRTLAQLRQKAQQFARLAEKGFDAAAQQMGLNVRVTIPPLRPSNPSLPVLSGTQNLVRWAFSSRVGQLSGVIETQNAFVVAQLVEAADPPYKPLESVRDTIRPKALNQQKAAYIRKRLRLQPNTSLEALQANYGPGAYIEQVERLMYGGTSPHRFSREEPVLLGVAAALAPQQLSAPIEGNSGVFVLQLTQKEAPKPHFPDRPQARGRLLSQTALLQYRFSEALQERLKVEDLRYRFGF